MTHEKIVLLSNVFLLRFNGLMFNAVCFVISFGNIDVEVRRSKPRHT